MGDRSEERYDVDVLQLESLVIRGWGNAYAFCTDDRLVRDIDRSIDERLKHLRWKFFRHLSRLNETDPRRLLAVYQLDDRKKTAGYPRPRKGP